MVAKHKPTILILCDYYLPGYRAGGPIRSLDGMISRMNASYRMLVVTRDRDLGDEQPYAFLDGVTGWQKVGDASVRYLSPDELTPWHLASILRSPYDVLYVNSLFSKWFSVVPLWLWKLRIIGRVPVVMAPRGELGTAPLRLRSRRLKKLYLGISSAVGLFRDVIWHASTEMEADEIRDALGSKMQIMTARDLAARLVSDAGAPKQTSLDTGSKHVPKAAGSLRAVFLSRITRKKNLGYAIELLKDVRHPVAFDIYGPKEDADYWQECEAIIRELPAMHTVRWMGVLEHHQVRETLSGYHLMLFPTLNENFGHVILEGLTAGCAVLTSDQTPWGSLGTSGAGWSLPLSDPTAFRDVLERCAMMDANEFAALRMRAFALGRRTVEDPEAIASTQAIFQRAAGHALT